MPLGFGARVLRGPTQTWTFWAEPDPPELRGGYIWMCSDLDPTPRKLSLSRYDPWYIAVPDDGAWDVMCYQGALVFVKWYNLWNPEYPNQCLFIYTSPDDGRQWYQGFYIPPQFP